MSKYCVHCGADVTTIENTCPFCGNQLQESTNSKYSSQLNSKEKKLAISSIVLGVLGIYPLLGLGGIIGMILAKKGLNANPKVYKRHLKIGFWISFSGFIFWLGAFIVTLIILLAPIFQFIWEMIIFYLRLLFGL